MTASNGPAKSNSEPRNAIAFDTPAPVDGKGVGETGSSSFMVSLAARPGSMKLRDGLTSGSHRWQDDLPPDLNFRYLADALGLSEMLYIG